MFTSLTEEELSCNFGTNGLDKQCDGGLSFCQTKVCGTEKPKVCLSIFTKSKSEPVSSLKLYINDCWDKSHTGNCHKDKCILQYSREVMYTCCCYGNLCNSNIIFPKIENKNGKFIDCR